MTTDAAQHGVMVNLQLWRIFGMGDVFEGRPERWEEVADAGPAVGDQLKVLFGDPPVEVVQALTEINA